MMLVVAPTVTDEGLPAVIERVSGYVTAHGGTVDSTTHENPWGRRRLAYPIEDHRDAFYVLYRFHAQAGAIEEIERDLKLDEQVIRYLLVRYDEMTEHEERPPRGQASAEGAPGAPFRRSQPAATTASAATAEEAAAPAEDAEAPAPAAEADADAAAGDGTDAPAVATADEES